MNYSTSTQLRSFFQIAALVLAFAAAGLDPLHAQTYSDVTITDSLTVDGALIAPSNSAATLPSAGLSTNSSYKSGLLWDAGKMALLVGTFPTSESSIGSNSIALNGTASGTNAFAALGSLSPGFQSFSEGYFTSATGSYALAMGLAAQATGPDSTAFGVATIASGTNSTALGFQTHAGAYASCAVGAYNCGSFANGGDTQWISADPIFEVGNGTSYNARSNALTVYKSGNVAVQGNLAVQGNVAVQGVLTAAPSSDIPMYTGN